MTQLSQELSDKLKEFSRSSESIRDRIKRYLSKISAKDQLRIIEARKEKPDWYIHWRQNKKHKGAKEIEEIMELPNSKQLGSHLSSLKVKPEKKNLGGRKKKLDLAWDKDITNKNDSKVLLEKREVSDIDKNALETTITRCPFSTDKKLKSEETLTNSVEVRNKNQNFVTND